MPSFLRRAPAALTAALLFVLALSAPPDATAQVPDTLRTPVGFSEPANVQPIDAYRLPDWHYAAFSLDGSLSGDASSREVDRSVRTRSVTDRSFRTNLFPRYEGFWESEARQLRLTVDPRFFVDYGKQTEDRTVISPERSVRSEERQSTTLVGNFRTEVNYDRYVASNVFLHAGGDLDYQVERTSSERQETRGDVTTQVEDVSETSDTYRSTTRLGIGVGRVRDVTPVIRALRIDERLRAIGEDGLSTAEVQTAAQQFAQFSGYAPIYDRPDKYFWGDFFDGVAGRDGLSALHTFYVADVLREPLGRRLDGAEVVVGPSLGLSDDDDDQEDVTADWGVFLSALWAHNPNLRNQFSAELDARFQRPDGEIATTWVVDPSVSWLWVLADRVQVNTSLLARLRDVRIDRPAPEEDATETEQYYQLRSTVTVFIENSLVVDGTVGLDHQRNDRGVGAGQTERTQWGVGFSVSFRYFLFRSLR